MIDGGFIVILIFLGLIYIFVETYSGV